MSVEKVSDRLLPSLAYGFDPEGDNVMQALKYLTRRFGSVSSFTGTYEADRFTLSIRGGLQDQSGNLIMKAVELPNNNWERAFCPL